jgi:hypothetical protein
MNVSLSIVGGTSNSFVYDLYNARYVKRTEVEVKEEATLAPPTLEVKNIKSAQHKKQKTKTTTLNQHKNTKNDSKNPSSIGFCGCA